jgi:transposase
MIPSRARVWIAMGHTDMRRGMQGLSLQVQEGLKRDPNGGDLFVFRGRNGSLVKILWHDGVGLSLYAKRLERGRFIWPSAKDGVVALTHTDLACLLDGIDWRNPQRTWRPRWRDRCKPLALQGLRVKIFGSRTDPIPLHARSA